MKTKPVADKEPTRALYHLGDGDLLVMKAGVQEKWLHRVSREPHVTRPRLNLTFRQTVR